MFATWFYWEGSVIQIIVLISHTMAAAEGVTLFPFIKTNILRTSVVVIFFLINDFFDYIIGTLQIFPIKNIEFFIIESVFMSIVFPVIIYLISRKK